MKRLAPPDIDPYAPGFLGEPWDAYRRLHAAGPLLWHAGHEMWLAPGHALARELLRSPAFPVIEVGAQLAVLGQRARRGFPALTEVLGAVAFSHNPPEHAAMRRFLVAVLNARPISSYVPAIREIAAELAAGLRDSAQPDAVVGFADRLPPLFMARLIGIPEADLPKLLGDTAGMIQVFNRVLRLSEYRELEERAARALDYFRRLAAERRRAPRDDGFARMMATPLGGQPLDDAAIARHCLVLFLVGVETTSTLIGSALARLLDEPEALGRLRREPALAEAAIEECLRLESPVQTATRIAAHDCELDGQRVRAGERVLVMFGAANRDPRSYEEPDRLRIGRGGPAHIAFGEGPHVCMGATLARTEARVALEAFLALPPARALGPSSWWPYDWLRRRRALRVEFGP